MAQLRPVPDRPLRAIALIRVSKVGDRGDDLISPELQRRAIDDYAKRRGANIVEWVEALDESASSSRSPWWARLDAAVAAIEAGHADAILVWKLSRAARHRRRWAVALDRVEVAGGILESATEGFDSTTSTGKLSRGLLAELAAWEADVRSEQWKETHARRYRLGLPHTRQQQFGYLWDETAAAYRPDPATRGVVRHLYAEYVTGTVGFVQLIRYLNDRGLRTSRGKVWGVPSLVRWMDAGFPAGLLPVGARAGNPSHRPGAHEPIIDAELWEAYLQTREALRRLPAKRRRPRHHLAGLVYCGLCMKPMYCYPYRNAHGVYEPWFRCSTYTNTRTCKGMHRSAKPIDEQVRRFIASFETDAVKSAAAQVAGQVAVARHDEDIDLLTRELDQLRGRGQKMLDRLDSGVISDADYLAWRAERDSQVTRLQQAVADAKAERQRLAQHPEPVRAASLLADWDRLVAGQPAELNAALRLWIRRIVIYPRSEDVRLRLVPVWADDGS